MIQLAVVQACDQVGRSRAARGKAYSQFAGEFDVRDRHEGSHFFASDLDEFDVASPLQRADHAVDAISRVAASISRCGHRAQNS
jgi:hypothetical protein